MGAENGVTVSDQRLHGLGDLNITFQNRRSMIARCRLPIRRSDARPCAELPALLARSDAAKDVEILMLRHHVRPVRSSMALGCMAPTSRCPKGYGHALNNLMPARPSRPYRASSTAFDEVFAAN